MSSARMMKYSGRGPFANLPPNPGAGVPAQTQDSTNELLEALKGLYQSGDYSDLTLSCGGKDYKLHKSIVCPRSDFFAAACRGHFKEAREGSISLPEDDARIVDLMIYYFYHLDYRVCMVSHGTECDRDLVGHKEVLGWELPIHVRAYAMAEKYGVVGLKAVALRKFEDAVKGVSWHHSHFVRAAREAYESTVETDRALRDVVLEEFKARPELLNVPEAQALLKEVPILAYDVLILVHRPLVVAKLWAE